MKRSSLHQNNDAPSNKGVKHSVPEALQFSLNPLKRKELRMSRTFFEQPCSKLAKALLGKTLVRKYNDGNILAGRIVEVECYFAQDDKCSHSYNYRQTKRNTAMFMKAGTLYVYMTYGMYYCTNISAKGEFEFEIY